MYVLTLATPLTILCWWVQSFLENKDIRIRSLQADVQQLEFKLAQLRVTTEENERAQAKGKTLAELGGMKRVAEFSAAVKRKKNRVSMAQFVAYGLPASLVSRVGCQVFNRDILVEEAKKANKHNVQLEKQVCDFFSISKRCVPS